MTTVSQSLEAMKRANEIKAERRALRARFNAGELTLDDLLHEPIMQNLRLVKLFQWIPRCGPHRTDHKLRRAGIPFGALERPIGRLTERQRDALIRELT